jgi:hypothetical protein
MNAHVKRSRLLVDPAVQFRLLSRLGAYLLIYTVALLHIGFAVEVLERILRDDNGVPVVNLYVDYPRQQKPLLVAMALLLPFLLSDLLKFSHRVVGPLFRCRKVMLDMAAGNRVGEFVTRKHDLMVELFEAFNVLIKAWNARVESATTETANTPAAEAPAGEETAEDQPRLTA